MKKISRRDFLKTTMAGTASAAMMLLFPGCKKLLDDFGSSQSPAPAGLSELSVSTDKNVSLLTDAGFRVDEQTVVIPGLQREYHFVFINDLHIIIPNDEVGSDAWDTVVERYEDGFMDDNGVKAYILWDKLVQAVNSLDIDGVLLGADMLDYFSQANFACLAEGCEQFQVPFLYIRADHDYANGYTPDITQDVIDETEKTLDSNSDIFYMDYHEFGIVGINNSTSTISDAGLQELERILDLEKPVILVIHVPFDSLVDEGLSQASKEVWQDRALLWGYEDTLYPATDNVKHLLDLIYDSDSPIAAVFAGHLHFEYDGKLTDTLTQHIFDASFRGTVGYITVCEE